MRLHVSCSMQVTLAVISAADAMVGKYYLKVNESKGGIFFLLFNPWCAGNPAVRLCCGVCAPPPPHVTQPGVPTLAPGDEPPSCCLLSGALSDSLTGMIQAQLLLA